MGLVTQNFLNLESVFQSILENSLDAVWAFDKEFKLIAFNSTFPSTYTLFFGQEFDEKKSLLEAVNEEKFEEWKRYYRRAIKERFKVSYEYKLNNRSLYYDLLFNPILENDQIVGSSVTCKDVTNRKHLEKTIKDNRLQITETKEEKKEEASLLSKIKKELEKSRENEARLKTVIDQLDSGFWEWDVEKDDIKFNLRYAEILGYNADELNGGKEVWENLIHPEDKSKVLEKFELNLKGNTSKFTSEHRLLAKTGKWIWVEECSMVTKSSENGSPLIVNGRISDITLKKNTVETLSELEERFYHLADNLPFMIWMSDEQNNGLYFNKTWLEYRGVSLENEINYNRKDSIHPDDFDYWSSVTSEAFAKKEEFELEYRLKKGNGEYAWVLDHGIPRFLKSGVFIGFVGAAFDVSDRKILSDQLLESETKFNEITSVIGEGIFVETLKGETEFVNPEFSRILGWEEKDLIGKQFHEIIHDLPTIEKEEEHDCPLNKVLITGDTYRISEDYFRHKNGELVPVSYVASPMLRNGKIIGAVIAFHDIRARKEYEAEIERFVEELQFSKEVVEENAKELVDLNRRLSESEEQLKELNANKDKFFSIISHDLKSPFTSLLGFSEYLVEDLDDLTKDEIKEFASNIHKAGKNVFNLLENLLQWSRIQTGRIRYSPTTFSLTELSESIIALYIVNAAKKKVKLISEITSELNIFADKFMIDTVLRNLISNAIKFTNAGDEIKIKTVETESKYRISVKDNGVGMKDQIKEKLFKISEHVTTKGTDQEKGTGLGLILCKEFVEKNGGKIWVESEVGKGSEFIFTIPKQLSKEST